VSEREEGSSYMCNKCYGTGVQILPVEFMVHGIKHNATRTIECEQCLGAGFVDWIQNILNNNQDKWMRKK